MLKSTDKCIQDVFSHTVYYIDFYQRAYKWKTGQVEQLLEDLFDKFNGEYESHKKKEPKKASEGIKEKTPYYLSTYVINEIKGRAYVVDGQQRLTTLTLILIALHRLAEGYSSKLQNWIKERILGYSGPEPEYWMHHEKHLETVDTLFNGKDSNKIDVSSGITSQNMVRNFEVIEKELAEHLGDKDKFETFVYYFMKGISLLELKNS